MAGDIGVSEGLVILRSDAGAAAPEGPGLMAGAVATGSAVVAADAVAAADAGRILHQYGDRVLLAALPTGAQETLVAAPDAEEAQRSEFESLLASLPVAPAMAVTDAGGPARLKLPDDLTETERLGVDAFSLRLSPAYAKAKDERPHQGSAWDEVDGAEPLRCTDVGAPAGAASAVAAANAGAPPLSQRLTGRVAVGLIMVSGPTAALQLSSAERTKVVAEVQNGLGWIGAQNDAGAVTFVYEIHHLSVAAQPLGGSPSGEQMEARFRDPAMAQLGYGAGLGEVARYANDLRAKLKTDWAYVAFFTKYPLGHFAYASIGGPRLVMQYANDGWGPDNIDRVFAHETGHVFGAPDEYTASGCSCGGSWGFYGKPNSNCEACAPGGGVPCLMKNNDWSMCSVTPYHLGFQLAEQRYSGVFRAGSGKYALWINASAESFTAKWQEYAGQGLRLADLDIVQVGNQRRYTGVWVAGTDAYGLWLNASWESFVAKWQQWSGQGLRLVGMEVVNVGNQNLYSGVFRAGTDAYGLWANATWESFRAKWQEWSQQNLRLVDLTITNFGNQRRYTGVFRAGSDGHGLWVNATWPAFEAKWKEWANANLRLVDLEITNFGGQRLYSGVFRAGTDGHGLWAGANWPGFKAKWEEWSAAGLRLVDIEVTDPANTVNAPLAGGAPAAGQDGSPDDEAGFGAVFGLGGDALDLGPDFNTGGMEAGPAAAPAGGEAFGHAVFGPAPSASATGPTAARPASEGGRGGGGADGGFGGIGGFDAPGSPRAAAASDGFGGIGGAGAGGGESDLDTGGAGGLG